MKKMLFTVLAAIAFVSVTNAQITPSTSTSQISKEDKAKMKAQQEADLTVSFKEAELTDDQVAKSRDILTDASKKSNDLKNNSALTDADKETEKKKINDEKNAKLKEIMGDKYKAWTAIRKKQKEAMQANIK